MKPCPDCGSGMVPADLMNCQKANFICTECAPDFVIARGTSFAEAEDEGW